MHSNTLQLNKSYTSNNVQLYFVFSTYKSCSSKYYLTTLTETEQIGFAVEDSFHCIKSHTQRVFHLNKSSTLHPKYILNLQPSITLVFKQCLFYVNSINLLHGSLVWLSPNKLSSEWHLIPIEDALSFNKTNKRVRWFRYWLKIFWLNDWKFLNC